MNFFGIGKGYEEEEEDQQIEEDKAEDRKELKEDSEDEQQEEKQAVEANVRLPPLIYERPQRRPKLSRTRLLEMQRLRRWNVTISKISIESLSSTAYDSFLEFVIGGDQRLVLKKTKAGDKMVKVGTLGYAVKTEVIPNIEYRKTRDFKVNIRHEYQGSYFNLLEQKLRIDIWDREKWGINNYMARTEVPLLELASGNIDQEVSLKMVVGNKKSEG
jgi:hypothetical protein